MRIWIAAVGTRPREGFDALAKMYLERMGALLPGGAKAGAEAPIFRSEQALWEAVERERARTSPMLVLLDERGKQMGSEAFAAWIGRERDGGRQFVIFAVGPADGWSDQRWREQRSLSSDQRSGRGEREGGPMQLSLGPMTMAHELARVVICEQVYRALTILAGHPYHRS